MKHEKVELVKRRNCKFFRDGMGGSHFKEFCHKIERKSVNIIKAYLNNSAEPLELVNKDHHSIIQTNNTLQNIIISKTFMCKKYLTSRMRARYIFSGKSYPSQNDSLVPCPPKKLST